MKKFLLICVMALFLFSCVQQRIVKSYDLDYSEKTFDNALEQKDFTTATIYYILNSDDKETSDKYKSFIQGDLKKAIGSNSSLFKVIRDCINLKQIDSSYQLPEYVIDYFVKTVNTAENYYFYYGLRDIVQTIFPEIKSKVHKNFSQTIFISGYDDVKKNTVTVVHDRGYAVIDGRTVPDIIMGTGFFISDTVLITNNHIVENNSSYSKLYIKVDNMAYVATVLLNDEACDLAYIQTPYVNRNFKYFKFAETINIGDEVIASGNPLGLTFSNTKGIISNVGRNITDIGLVYQTDTPINPGNSGGPVFNNKFELIGIAFATLQKSQNLNFILPSEFIVTTLPYISLDISFKRTWLGIYFYENLFMYMVKSHPNFFINKQKNYANNETLKLNKSKPVPIKELVDMQLIISSLSEGTIVSFEGNAPKKFVLMERPKYTFLEAVLSDDQNNLIVPILDADIERDVDFFTIKKLFNIDVGLYTGIKAGDKVKIEHIEIDNKNKLIYIILLVKHLTTGGSVNQFMLANPFSIPGFM